MWNILYLIYIYYIYIYMLSFTFTHIYIYIYIRAVKISTLMQEIIFFSFTRSQFKSSCYFLDEKYIYSVAECLYSFRPHSAGLRLLGLLIARLRTNEWNTFVCVSNRAQGKCLRNSVSSTGRYAFIYIYAFSWRFYPKWLTVYSGYHFFFYQYVFPGNWTHNLLHC